MSDAEDIRKSMQIVEGDLIPTVRHTLRLPMLPYELSELLKQLASPDTYNRGNTKGREAIMMFYDPIQYERTKKLLNAFGVSFSEELSKEAEEIKADEEGQKSPYPSNSHIQKHWP